MNRGWVWPIWGVGRARIGGDTCSALIRRCVEVGLFQISKAWVYGWNEFEILLPQVLHGVPDPQVCDRLSLFSPAGELRLQGEDGSYFAWFLAEEPSIESMATKALGDQLQLGSPRSFLTRRATRMLVGKRRGGVWQEVRFPRSLEYGPGPDTQGERLTVHVVEYLEYAEPRVPRHVAPDVAALPVRLATVRYSRLDGESPGGEG